MHSSACLILLLCSVAACGGTSTPAPAEPSPAENTLPLSLDAERAQARTLIDRACACPDPACVSAAVAELDHVVMTFSESNQVRAEIDACHSPVLSALEELAQIARDACACRDTACADQVQDQFGAFMQRHKDSKGSEAEAERAGIIAEGMMECLVAAQNGGEAP